MQIINAADANCPTSHKLNTANRLSVKIAKPTSFSRMFSLIAHNYNVILASIVGRVHNNFSNCAEQRRWHIVSAIVKSDNLLNIFYSP